MTYFDCPFVDVDEWRSHPVPHRYVHGGFTGTDTRFSFYFPEPDRYEGRLLQFLQGGVGGDESTAIGPHPSGADIGFAFHCGAYLVESNQGHIGLDLSGDPRVMNHAASIAAARYSKEIAAQMYGAPPHHAYVYGPSGGGLRTIACAEHGDGFYDGAVPYVAGGTNYGALLVKMSAIANVIDLFTEAQLDAIGDATDVGGHGNPFAGLDTPRREALAALYRSGFPRRAERQIRTHGQALMIWAWDALTITTFDPDYFERFWTEPGYAGADGLLADRLVAIETTVGALCDAATVLANTDSAETGAGRRAVSMFGGNPDAVVGLVPTDGDPARMLGATIRVKNGQAAGRVRYCIGSVGNVLLSTAISGPVFDDLAPGDAISIDNSEWLAFCYYHRHLVHPSNPSSRQFMIDAQPIYPTRPLFPTQHLRSTTRASDHSGRFGGKMTLVQNLVDDYAWPDAAVTYQQLVRQELGEAIDDRFRLWFHDNACHLPTSWLPTEASARLVDNLGAVQQAIRDLIDWVERGVSPSPSSVFDYTADGALTLAPFESERGGIQPAVLLFANGQARCEVERGQDVVFRALVKVPRHIGCLVAAEWDFEGTGEWPRQELDVVGRSETIELRATHRYDRPGTYFPALRVFSHREGDAHSPYCRVANLGRARVVVT